MSGASVYSAREVEDERVASHVWPLDSADVVVSSVAVCRSQDVLSLSTTEGLERRKEELASEGSVFVDLEFRDCTRGSIAAERSTSA